MAAAASASNCDGSTMISPSPSPTGQCISEQQQVRLVLMKTLHRLLNLWLQEQMPLKKWILFISLNLSLVI